MKKRNHTKLFILMAVMMSQPIMAQKFKKFKSKTNLKKNVGESISDELDEINANPAANDVDQFGRNKKNKKIKVNDKFVSLNPETAFGPEIVEKFEFEKANLTDLTKHMQKLTGINLILDKDLKGKVTISASTAITVGDAWKAYLTALSINGYTLVKNGAFYNIVQQRDIRYTPTKIYTGEFTPNTDNFIMKIIPLEHINSKEITRSFRPFMTRYGRIIEIPETNTVLIQDSGVNVNRLTSLIKFIDIPGYEETLQIIPVKHSSAQELAKLLDQILKVNQKNKAGAANAGNKRSSISKIIAEPRTNSIIAMADLNGAKQLKTLISQLDIAGANKGGDQIHVYYLNHGDSETLAKTLSSLVSGNSSKKSRFSGKDGAPESQEELFSSEVKITADKENNAIVVTASPTDWITIKSVIQKLDIPRDQVYVEGMIMETQINRGSGFGISIVGAYGDGGTQKFGFTGGSGGQDLLNLLTNNITSLGGLFIGGGAGPKVDLNAGGQTISINSVSALITAIANNSNTNVLATPQILALDNTEASFEVGESVPVAQQTIANNQTQISVKQQKAGLTLKITPQINKVTRFIKLKIDQKIEEFQARANSSAAGGLATTNRAAVTTVVVKDKDTIAMGGLMRDQSIESVSKVPLLGDIPIVGWLFKNKTKTVSKVNLLFFLTPQIMDSYQKTVGERVQTNLKRRASHLKFENGAQDPFGKTVKSLYEKAKLQKTGELQKGIESFKAEQTIGPKNPTETKEVKVEAPKQVEEVEEVEKSENDAFDQEFEEMMESESASKNLEAPNYKDIIQKLKMKNASRLKGNK